MKIVIAEKSSVAQSIAKVIGANERGEGYLEGNGYVVSWCVGHLPLGDIETDDWLDDMIQILQKISKSEYRELAKKQIELITVIDM